MDYDTSMSETKGVHPIRAALARHWPPMTQAALARRLEMNPSVLGLYLNGKRVPPEGFYIAAAAVLGCDPDELIPREVVA
jgi:Helix-turn-helix domain